MIDVVVMNHDRDVLDGIADAIESLGLHVAPFHVVGPTVDELASFIHETDPRVVVYDLGPPPLERAVERWRELCRRPEAHRPYVVTTTNKAQLEPHECMVECVLMKPMTFDDIRDAVCRVLEREPDPSTTLQVKAR